MSKVIEKSASPDRPSTSDDRLVIDGRYLREQATEAATLFLAPVSGIVRALAGAKGRSKQGRKAA